MPYTILGSCVTRDAAEIGRNPLPRPVATLSRTTVQSMVSSPTPIDDDIGVSSNWGAGTVLRDFRKRPLEVISTLDHPLIIDLIDERLEMLHTGYGIVTKSQFLEESNIDTTGWTPVERDWELAPDGPFALAAATLCAKIPDIPVVIHRAFWADRNKDGTPWPTQSPGRHNPWLARAYDILQANLPQAVSVEVGREHRLADPDHKWGSAPFHYVTSYYDEFSRLVRSVLALD